MNSTVRRLILTLVAALIAAMTAPLGVAGIVPMAAAAGQGCPVGQHEDTQRPGFQCVPGWSASGTLLDGVTGSCVAPPGVPPPPLS